MFLTYLTKKLNMIGRLCEGVGKGSRRENRNGKFGFLFMRSWYELQHYSIQLVHPGSVVRSKEVV